MTEAPQAPAIPPSEDEVSPSPSQRRYQTRRPPTTPGASSSRPKKSVSRPPTKKSLHSLSRLLQSLRYLLG
ncbi:hypothetical protein AAG906_023641 [Vitis piasezkii]